MCLNYFASECTAHNNSHRQTQLKKADKHLPSYTPRHSNTFNHTYTKVHIKSHSYAIIHTHLETPLHAHHTHLDTPTVNNEVTNSNHLDTPLHMYKQ